MVTSFVPISKQQNRNKDDYSRVVHVSTIIVSYNTFNLTVKAIESAIASSPELQHEIIVVDNNSPDDSGSKLRDYFSDRDSNPVTVIRLNKNLGFSGANNVGAAQAKGEVLFFLNPDTEVHPATISKIYAFLTEHDDVGVLGPYVINPGGSDQGSVSSFITVGSLIRFFFPSSAIFQSGFAKKANIPDKTKEVDILKGCAVALRRKVFDQIGGWDESYFLYAEERELCYAAKNLGYKNYFLRSAPIMHIGGASTSLENYAAQQIIQQQSSLQFLQRHHGLFLVVLNRALGVLGFGIRASIFPILELMTKKSHYQLRGQAAKKIFLWYVQDYKPKRA